MAQVPVQELLQRLAAGKNLLGVAVTPLSVEVAVLGPPYTAASKLRGGHFLSPEELHEALVKAQATAVVLGGTAAFRTDGSLQLGVRKLVSRLQGLTYDSDWLPSRAPGPAPGAAGAAAAAGGGGGGACGAGAAGEGQQPVPIWLCRRGQDDAARMVLDHVRAYATAEQRRAWLVSAATAG